jgi:hypothetical protein
VEQRSTASIQVGTLRSGAEAEGWHVESNYAYLDFYAFAQQTLGVEHANWAEAYELVSEKLYHVSTGDWIFTQRHGDAPARAEYFDLLRAKRIDEATISLIDTLREVADRHVAAATAALLRAAPDHDVQSKRPDPGGGRAASYRGIHRDDRARRQQLRGSHGPRPAGQLPRRRCRGGRARRGRVRRAAPASGGGRTGQLDRAADHPARHPDTAGHDTLPAAAERAHAELRRLLRTTASGGTARAGTPTSPC